MSKPVLLGCSPQVMHQKKEHKHKHQSKSAGGPTWIQSSHYTFSHHGNLWKKTTTGPMRHLCNMLPGGPQRRPRLPIASLARSRFARELPARALLRRRQLRGAAGLQQALLERSRLKTQGFGKGKMAPYGACPPKTGGFRCQIGLGPPTFGLVSFWCPFKNQPKRGTLKKETIK